MHEFMCTHSGVFTWDDMEWGLWHHDFFVPVDIPTVKHKVWVERSIPIPRGQLEEFCKVIAQGKRTGVQKGAKWWQLSTSPFSATNQFKHVLVRRYSGIRLVVQ
jgi:hypothetical protein